MMAGLQFEPSEAGTLGGALQALFRRPFGSWMLGVVALGLIAYGLLMLAMPATAGSPRAGPSITNKLRALLGPHRLFIFLDIRAFYPLSRISPFDRTQSRLPRSRSLLGKRVRRVCATTGQPDVCQG
jgi:hypothetical protein